MKSDLTGLPKQYVNTLKFLGLNTRVAVTEALDAGKLEQMRGIGPTALREIRAWLGLPEPDESGIHRTAVIQCPHCHEAISISLGKGK